MVYSIYRPHIVVFESLKVAKYDTMYQSYIMPVYIGSSFFRQTLAMAGESLNVPPTKIYRRWKLGKIG